MNAGRVRVEARTESPPRSAAGRSPATKPENIPVTRTPVARPGCVQERRHHGSTQTNMIAHSRERHSGAEARARVLPRPVRATPCNVFSAARCALPAAQARRQAQVLPAHARCAFVVVARNVKCTEMQAQVVRRQPPASPCRRSAACRGQAQQGKAGAPVRQTPE